MASDEQIIDRNGDRWYVCECEADEDCFVLERFKKKPEPNAEFDMLVARYAIGVSDLDIRQPDEPARDSVHIPRDVLIQIADALKEADRDRQ